MDILSVCILCFWFLMQNSFFHLHINLYAGYYSTSTKSASYKTLQQDINFVLVKTLQPGGHIYEIAEKPPLQHFEGNTTMSVVLTLWELLISVRPSPSSWIAVTSSHDYPLNLSASNSGCTYIHNDPPKNFRQTIIQNLHPEFLLHFQK